MTSRTASDDKDFVTSSSPRPPHRRGRNTQRSNALSTSRATKRVRRRARRRRRRTIVGRHPFATVAVILVLLFTPTWISLGEALSNPGYGSSPSVRLAEWARQSGGGSVVAWVENYWYSHHQPPLGGHPAPGAIPAPASSPGVHVANGVTHLAAPLPLVPIASPAVRGEGDWHPVGRLVDGVSAIYETYLRPDTEHTSTVVGVAWMDTKLLKATLYSGSQIPGGGPYTSTAPVEPHAARSLVAAFNAGFLMADARGGYYTDGRVVLPLRTGAASFVIHRDGSVTIGAWRGRGELTSDVVAVRQNLQLLVNDGRPVPGLAANDISQWGATLGNQVYVWRSGVGVTANGALVYVGGPGLNITSLANVLVRAGAVRAMEFDINTDWVNLTTFRPTTANGTASVANASLLLPTMQPPGRYFASWWVRDFITMSGRGA